MSYFLVALTLWAIQVQIVVQIILNRISMVWSNPRHKTLLWWGVTAWITLINISVYCIWLPATLRLSDNIIMVNRIWDRLEKFLYLLTDAALNVVFIRSVKKQLVANGLTKYDKLVRFNTHIMAVSLSMDLLIIGMMSAPDRFYSVNQTNTAIFLCASLLKEMEMSAMIVAIIQSTHQLRTIHDHEPSWDVMSPYSEWYEDDDDSQSKRRKNSPVKSTSRYRPQLQILTTSTNSHRFQPAGPEKPPARRSQSGHIPIELPPMALLAEDVSDEEKPSTWSDFLKSPIMTGEAYYPDSMNSFAIISPNSSSGAVHQSSQAVS
ncbi:uncharacterized protein MELLADRAFT_89799 [Melampsora larici-populina 98AG31]|uniref:Uncharacterized protein n=1 Tax=Melampsora larici-populina (strain 98AG31 / pathotype 3-4-7) TaxID=747676 RepID=F4RUP0_MELLP|nr:uncharacterized protein MELLADRAFT_89799 [Melampsora larici-populina 98AG31]EGG03889.1 hypothetical protein MELLADRAFT_89799 [Melampsora larici-populina 98AG31]